MQTPHRTLNDLLMEDDELGLLDVKPLATNATTEADRVRQQFEEINVFADRHGFPPGHGPEAHKASVSERQLQMRLKAYQTSREVIEQLRTLDRHGLLAASSGTEPEPKTLDDILDLDDELLIAPGSDIFDLRHARPAAARPDKVSERKACKDFEQFKPLFAACVFDLTAGKRKSMPFANEQEIKPGEFFILNGVMVYVAEVNDPHVRNGKRNARLRLIFENGTEGGNLLRSLATELYKDPNGRRISDPIAGPLYNPEQTTKTVEAPEGRITGCIYVVKSLSAVPEIARLHDNLFKIGFTTGRFEDRIRNAKDDPTFLLAPVHPVRTYEAIDMNTNKFENLMHRFFMEARLDIEIKDCFGKPFKPREWYLLPLSVIENAIRMLLDGSIVKYRYDAKAADIVARD